MHSDIQALINQAEDKSYLQQSDIVAFKSHVASLAQRLEVYQRLRDQEIDIFQPIADQIVQAYPAEKTELLEKALKHWLAVMRYSAMAMLLNNPEYLQRRILEWLTEMMQAHQMQSIENTIYNLLLSSLTELLSPEQLALLQPFLKQAQTTLLNEEVYSTAEG